MLPRGSALREQGVEPAAGLVEDLDGLCHLLGRAGARHLRGGEALVPADFTAAFVIAAAVVLSALPGFWALPRDTGADVSGHRP